MKWGVWGHPEEILSIKYLISCIEVIFYAPICAISAPIYDENAFIYITIKVNYYVNVLLRGTNAHILNKLCLSLPFFSWKLGFLAHSFKTNNLPQISHISFPSEEILIKCEFPYRILFIPKAPPPSSPHKQ